MRHKGLGLAAAMVPRTQQRLVDQRSEDRQQGVIESATVHFRGQPYEVAVVNISSRGTMIESALMPRIGETMLVRFDGCSPVHAFVRWIRDGRIGLNFGHEIVLG